MKRPPPPKGLGKAGRAAWVAILAEHPLGHFSDANLVLLEQLARARDLSSACDEEIARSGLLIGGKVNPLVDVRARAWAEIRHCATKLRVALSASTRTESATVRADPAHALRKPWELDR